MLKLGLTKDAPGAKWCKIWEIEQNYMSMKQKSSQNIRTVSHLSYGYVFDVFLKNMNENQ